MYCAATTTIDMIYGTFNLDLHEQRSTLNLCWVHTDAITRLRTQLLYISEPFLTTTTNVREGDFRIDTLSLCFIDSINNCNKIIFALHFIGHLVGINESFRCENVVLVHYRRFISNYLPIIYNLFHGFGICCLILWLFT